MQALAMSLSGDFALSADYATEFTGSANDAAFRHATARDRETGRCQ